MLRHIALFAAVFLVTVLAALAFAPSTAADFARPRASTVRVDGGLITPRAQGARPHRLLHSGRRARGSP